MNIIMIIIIVLLFLFAGLAIAFLMFTRQGKNIVAGYFYNKKYVICHIKKEATDFEDIWKIVPKPDYLTKVGKFDYDLNPNYSILKWKGRLHYLLKEGDVIPQYITRKDTNEEILIQVQEVRTALHNTAYDFLYRKNQNLALLVAFAALALTMIVAVYAAYEISKVDSAIQSLISLQQSAQITIGK
jgi:ABC-type glycerol-3-phosphate transport system permease component